MKNEKFKIAPSDSLLIFKLNTKFIKTISFTQYSGPYDVFWVIYSQVLKLRYVSLQWNLSGVKTGYKRWVTQK